MSDSADPAERGTERPNVALFGVSELAAALKRTVEEAFGYVRVRGEICDLKIASSGHCYLRLKEDTAVLDGIIWRGAMAKLGIRPEEGMEVIASGRVTTYPGRSSYQIVIESVELAGQGALLKLLEERRKKLAAEGLFDDARKKPLPHLPAVVGVITSPTGAVIRDILHRIADRFPRRVIVWPVKVQGEGAAAEIAAAIIGFNAANGLIIPVPDVLIVARGGGSVEDLWAFNEEIVVRAAAASRIPLIAAVGHETDWTLIDHAADRRAPTPTAAAEMAVPVRLDLQAGLQERHGRLSQAIARLLTEHRIHLTGLVRGIPRLDAIVAQKTQDLDGLVERLARGPRALLDAKVRDVAVLAARLNLDRFARDIDRNKAMLADMASRFVRAGRRATADMTARLAAAAAHLESLSPMKVLERGYVLVRDAEGAIMTKAKDAVPGAGLALQFTDGIVGAHVSGAPPSPSARRVRAAPPKNNDPQGSLL